MLLPLQMKWCWSCFLLCAIEVFLKIWKMARFLFDIPCVLVSKHFWKLVSLDLQVNYTAFPCTELQLSESFISARETENRSSEFSITILFVPLGYWKNWDTSVKYCRQNNMHINQRLETVSKMLFIASFHQICIILMMDTLQRQTL